LRLNDDAVAMAVGSTGTSIGATMMVGGIALASSANWGSGECPACIPAVLLMLGGFHLSLMSLFSLGEYGGLHQGRGHHRRVTTLATAMSHPSADEARSERLARMTVAWTFFTTGVALAGGGLALFAMGHQSGFDDTLREGLAGFGAFAGGWLVTIASAELAHKWTNELAVAPTRGGAMLTYERRF
jgi:hypothetical protein